MKKIFKKLSLLVLVFLLLLSPFESYKVWAVDLEEGQVLEEEKPQPSPEELEAQRQAEIKAEWERQVKKHINKSPDQLTTAYLVGDFESGKILEAKNIDDQVAIASTSKILSIFVVLDEIKAGNISKDDLVYIDKDVAKLGGSSYKLKEGEEVTVDDLIKAALIVSGNDAVKALAKHLAGSEEVFVEKMKIKLDSLNIDNYQLINSSGLPNYNIDMQNMMTTRGLFKLTRAFIQDYPEVLQITSMAELVNVDRDFKETNTNPLLKEDLGVDGLKTGYTGLAGRCLVATATKKISSEDQEDLRLISITMGSESEAARYVAAKKLLENAMETYAKKKISNPNLAVETVVNDDLDPREVNIYPKEAFSTIIKTSDFVNYSKEVVDLVPPLKAGQEVGQITYYLNGKEVFTTALIIKQDVIESSFLSKLQNLYGRMYMSLFKIFND
ncbi:MAG: D-alanyl-D-alanine carboxypeptidase family protein [Bacillota bacterium]|nr:D-alanyl-D-alanine carboxypeptidase family protein [Bacillota bacterium]